MIMNKKFLTLAIALMSFLCVSAQEYNHSIGLTVGSLSGFSYKYWATEDFAFQLDIGFQAIETRTSGILISGPGLDDNSKFVKRITYYGGRLNPNLLWQKEIAEDWNLFLGGGFSADLIRDVEIKDLGYINPVITTWSSSNKYAVKFGLNAIMGIEYCLSGPLNLSLDFRPGYTVAYDNIDAGYKYYLGAFDWNLCLGLRFRI